MRQDIREIPVSKVKVTDRFWLGKMDLVRREMLPYQWEVLHDRVSGAPSYAIHNFKAAAAQNERRRAEGDNFVEPVFGQRDFAIWPEDPEHPDPDAFYGFLFQDTDVYKWVEAASYSLMTEYNETLARELAEVADLIAAAQREDGYLDTYYQLCGMDKALTNLKSNHELYCFGHLTEAAVAHHSATGSDVLLNVARKCAAFWDRHLGPEEGKKRGYPGHEIAEMALAALYEATEEAAYFRLGKFFIDERGQEPLYFLEEGNASPEEIEARCSYNQAHIPVRDMREAVGHAVRAGYLYSGMADFARITGDEALAEACRALWDDVTTRKMSITGGVGSTHFGEAYGPAYDLPSDTCYNESCASIAVAFWARRMFRIEPNSKYTDMLEWELYNTVLAGMALDGKSFFYVNPLQITPELEKNKELAHVKFRRQKWFGCACCPPNIARLIASIGAYLYMESADGLYVNLYAGSEVQTARFHVSCEADLPMSGEIKLVVSGRDDVPASIYLRIPAWCQGEYSLAAPEDAEVSLENGYLKITKVWGCQEEIGLTLAMPVRLMTPSFRVREELDKVAVTRGPLCYCLEEADNGGGLYRVKIRPDTALRCAERRVNEEEIMAVVAQGSDVAEATEETGTRAGEPERPAEDRSDAPSAGPAGFGDLYVPFSKRPRTPRELTFIPYYTWANRELGEMQVFTAVE